MIYRIDELTESKINPITEREYDSSWIILMLTDSEDYQQMCGSRNGCAYTVKLSRTKCDNWKIAVCDFIGLNEANAKNIILVMTEKELETAQSYYNGHSYKDSFLRGNEPSVLIHSTTMNSWEQIQRDGMLKSWNTLKTEKLITEKQPIGIQLGDPTDFSDYIMFGGGVTGEIVVNSKQQGKIVMDIDSKYLTGARLYFDAKRMAQDGLLIRDGCHLKVKDTLPLVPYLIWAATWETIGLTSQFSTPKIFTEQSDKHFDIINHYDSLIDENNDPVHDPKPLREYMDKWDGQDFISQMELNKDKSVLEIGVGTGRLAIRVAPLCGEFYGVDISPKTIECAKENLAEFTNVKLTCADFLSCELDYNFDVVYSSLTFMHIEDKQKAVNKIAGLLNDAGRFVLSIDKNPSELIDIGMHKIRIFPDTPDKIAEYIKRAGLIVLNQYDTEFATIFVAQKSASIMGSGQK